MKKIFLLVLAFAILCGCLTFGASLAEMTVEGISGSDNYYYSVNEPLTDVPRTIEAVIYMNKRMPSNTAGGAIVGNFRGFSQNPDFTLEIEKGGKPKIKFKDGDGEQAITFSEVSVLKSE